jgi:hypothetical protein
MRYSVEPEFERSKHAFGYGQRSVDDDHVFAADGTRWVIGACVSQKESGTKSERLDKPCPVGDS